MTKGGQSDQELIERYVAGDKSTLDILVRRWHKIFCEKAFWVLRDKALAKDVAQECWIIIIRKLPSLKKLDSFRHWALRIVYTKAIDAHKKRTKENRELDQLVYGANYDSEDIEIREMLKVKLLKAIRDLSRDKQEIIRLFYLEEYSLKEISNFLEVPVGTVKSRLFKAREKLKSVIKS